MKEAHIPSAFLLSTLADINIEEGNNTAASNVSLISYIVAYFYRV